MCRMNGNSWQTTATLRRLTPKVLNDKTSDPTYLERCLDNAQIWEPGLRLKSLKSGLIAPVESLETIEF